MTTVRILIRNRKGVFDPEGKVIHGGLKRLGYAEVSAARVGKVIDLVFEDEDEGAIAEKVEAMCKAFLVNPVIEDYSYEILSREG
jgi:phosphoribosylformylglycinamidine synthase